jgi:hypothetical protein
MLTTGLASIREMLNEDAHGGTLQGLVIFKNTGRDLLDGISKANELCFTFWGSVPRLPSRWSIAALLISHVITRVSCVIIVNSNIIRSVL